MADQNTPVRIVGKDDGASDAFKRVAGEAGKLGSAVSSVGGSFAALGTTAVAGVSAISFASKIQDAINLADSFNKLSQKTGVAVEDLSKLNYAAGLADVSTEALATGLKKLNLNISQAGNGSKEQAALFKALGVSVKDAAGNMRSADKVFADLADVFSGSADGANKTAIAVALLGKNGSDLIPLLNGGKGAIKDLGDEAKKLGIVLGTDFAKSAEDFNDNLHKLQLSGQGLFVTLGSDLVKALGNSGKAAAEAAIEHGKLAGVLAGLDVLFHGDKQFKADKAFVGEFDALMEKEGQLAQLRAAGAKVTDARVVGIQAEITGLKGLIAQTQAYRKELEGVAKVPTKVAPVGDSEEVRKAARGLNNPGPAQASVYDTINKSIQERIALAKQELDVGRQLTDAEKFGIKVASDMDAAKSKLSATERGRLQTSVQEFNVLAAKVDLQERASKADLAAAAARVKYMESLTEGLAKSREEVQTQIDHNNQLGLGVVAIAEMEAARLNEQATILDGVAIKNMDRNLDQAEYDAIKAKAAALRELASLKVQGAIKEQGIDTAKKIEEEWRRSAESINSTLTDALMRGFESGKDFARNMRDTIVNMFKTLVLRPVISAVVNPVAQGINSFLYGSGPQGTGSVGLGGNVSNAMGLNSLYGAGAQWLGGASAGASSLSLGYANAVGAVGGDSLGALIGANGGWAGVSTGAVAAEGAGAAAGSAAAGGSITGALAAVPVWGWIALAAIAIASKAKGETRSGGQYAYDSNTGVAALLQGPSGGEIEGDVVRKSIAGTVGGLNYLLKGLDSKATITGAQAGVESSDRGRGGVFFGGSLSTGATFGESGKGSNYEGTLYEQTSSHSVDSKTALENFTTDLMQGTIQALQAAGDIPKSVAAMISGVDAESLTKEAATALVNDITTLVTGVNNFRAAIEGMPFEELKGLSFDAAQGLIAVAGGMERLGANLGTYYDNFYTDEEKRAKTVANINKATAGTGFDAATATRAQFRALVEAQDLNTEAGRKMYATLLGLSGAFAGITESAGNAATAIADAAKKLQDAASDALDGLQRAVGADKDRLTALYEAQSADISAQIDKVSASVGKLQTLSNTLKSTLDGMRLSGADGAYRQAAQAQISAALATARAGGPLPLDGQLDSALRTVSQPSEQLFATFQDYARDFYRTANDITALSDITGTQLTAEQLTQKLLESQLEAVKTGFDKEIKRLDGILDTAKLQLDAARGIDTSIKSVAQALAIFNAALTNVGGSASSSAAPSGYASGAVVVGGGGAMQGAPAQTGSGFWMDVNLLGTRVKHDIDDPARIAELTTLRDFINATFDGSKESLEKIKAAGGTQANIATASGYYLEDIRKLYEGVGIPAFASGGTFAGGLRVVGENGPELEATGPARIWNSNQLASALTSGGASNAELADELRALRAAYERQQALLESIARSSKDTAGTMLAVTQGGDSIRSTAV